MSMGLQQESRYAVVEGHAVPVPEVTGSHISAPGDEKLFTVTRKV